jgi:hypothetical protein
MLHIAVLRIVLTLSPFFPPHRSSPPGAFTYLFSSRVCTFLSFFLTHFLNSFFLLPHDIQHVPLVHDVVCLKHLPLLVLC